MVLESLVVYLLDKYLGDFIENLDTKKLKIDVWSGNVVLENLYLKPNALADLNLPVTISIGYLEKLILQVPWKNLYTNPTKATIDGLYLLVVPKTEVGYDAKRDEKEQHEAKMREVHKVEQLRKEKEAEKNAEESSKSNDTFVERMQLQVIRNLELSIRNIHIVYEDRSTKPDHPFAMGITLNYITLHTTTPDWQPTILKADTPSIHKLGELSGFSIYWNTNAKSRSALSRDEAIKDLKSKIAVDNQHAPTDISYILRPLNVKAKVILVMKPGAEKFQRPMFDIKVGLDEISLNINRDQYSDVLDLLEFQDYLSLKSRYIKYQAPVHDADKAGLKRWKFAYEAIVNEEVRPRFECYKWENIQAHLNRCREYRSIHIEELTGKLSNEKKQRAEALEKKLDVFNLTYIRLDAEIEANRKKAQEPKSWWGNVTTWWGGSKPQDNPELDLEKVMSPEEKKKLYEAIGYDENNTSTSAYPTDYIDIDLGIQLKMLDVNIWSKINQTDTQYRVIARAAIPDTGLVFQRRPAAEALAVFVDLGSFQVVGLATNTNLSELSNEGRPILVQPLSRLSPTSNQEKLLRVEFEIDPLKENSYYRIKVVSQSLEIKYNAPTINKLAECFEQDTERKLQGVKQVAYSTYTDVKHRSYILMKHNVEKIKALDIDIDIQSAYFLLPENGVYRDDAAAICMDFGHFTVKRAAIASEQPMVSTDAPDIDDVRQKSYTQFEMKLENVQLIYAHQNESWQNACKEKNTPLHLIKPMQLELDVGKCIYSDDSVLPAFKVAGNVPNIDLRLSDKRLFQIINHIQSIPFPESKASPVSSAEPIEAPSTTVQSAMSNAEETLETIEGMTPVKKMKEKAETRDATDKDQAEERRSSLVGQLTQLEATFTLDKIDIHIDEAMNDTNGDEPFLRITLEYITVKSKVKTFDMEFEASLADLIVYHEQFIGKDNQQLRLLAAQVDKTSSQGSQKLVNVNFLHTSKENPLFSSVEYNSIENQAHVHFSKLMVTLQLEALLSILRFQDSLMKKLPNDKPLDETKVTKPAEILPDESKATEKDDKIVKKTDTPASPTLQINADLEEFRIILASKQAKLFDIQVQGIKAEVSQAPEKTLVNLILCDLRILDPYKEARYRKIISQQGESKELLRVDISLFNYPEAYEKPVDVFDCDVKVQFAKANILFLFKHIDAMLSFLDSLNITKAALNVASNQAGAAYEQVQKLQEQAFKVHLDVTFNAPTIIIPTNSYSDEALYLDLGKLTLKTNFLDDPKKFLVEQQNVRLENVLASRVKLDEETNIIGEAVLLECAELNTQINRLLYPDRVKDQPGVSIKVEWESVHFQLAKDDYSCVMRVLMENFSENIRDQIPEGLKNDQFHYRQEEQEKEEDEMRNAVIKKQKESQGTEVLQTMRLRAEIKKLALTLYLGESDLRVRRGPRDERRKLANVQIDILEAMFRQQSDSSYKAVARVKNFLLDDLRDSNKPDSVTRMMDRHFTVDPDAQMFVASFEFLPKTPSRPMALRLLNAQLESLYISISLDYLMTLQDFFISGLPTAAAPPPIEGAKVPLEQQISSIPDGPDSDKNRPTTDKKPAAGPSKAPAKPPTSVDAEVETRIDVIIKNPQIILLEDQHNGNSNCLVLDLAFQMRMISVGNDSKLYGWLKDLTVYSSNFAELKNSNNKDSKVKYRILQPAKVDVVMITSETEQKIDLRISDIVVSMAPAALRTLIAVTSSLGTLQVQDTQEKEKVNEKVSFDPAEFKDKDFWFTKEAIEESTKKQEETKNQENVAVAKVLAQQLVFILDSIEMKVEVGQGAVTKSVVAMRLSNLTADVKNWSSDMSLSSTLNIEAALFNEHMLAWEPLIEPTIESGRTALSPWCVTCSILPFFESDRYHLKSIYNVLPLIEQGDAANREGKNAATSKQILYIRADQLLNITITKTGLDLVQRLSTMFNDVYNKRLPAGADDDLPMLSLFNSTGRELSINQLQGLQFADDSSLSSITLKENQSIPMNVWSERQMAARLSVLDDQDYKRRQEFSVKIGDQVKTVSINRTWKRVYDLGPSANPNWPVQMLCDAQVRNDRRRIILSSIIRIYNNTTMPLMILGVDSTGVSKSHRVGRIEVNDDFHVPIDLLYKHSSSPIFIAVDEDEDANDFFSFDWEKEFAVERKLKLKNGTDAHFIVFKELTDAYSENTNQLDRISFCLYIHPALHLTNLLPVDVQFSVDNGEHTDLKPSQLQLISAGNKSSSLKFTIPSYNNVKWISDPIDLKAEGRGDHNEHMAIFHDAAAQQTMKLVLRVDAYHESFRLSLYSPYWILNRSDLQLDFQIENNLVKIDPVDTPFLLCSEKFGSDGSKKGQLRVYGIEQPNAVSNWSEKFPLDVIKSIGMATCKLSDDRTYMICVDIATSSFGLTKLVTLLPSMSLINRSSVDIDVIEMMAEKGQNQWATVRATQSLPYWPKYIKDGLMRIRYSDNQILSSPFKINQQHQTLLRMNDEQRPAIFVEVRATEFDGVRVIFQDYKIGDASVLIVNCVKTDVVSFCQENDEHTQILPPLNYMYYTWSDPLKSRKLVVSCGSKKATLELNPQCGSFGQDGQQNVTFAAFVDGVQTVLLFSTDEDQIKTVSGARSLAEPTSQRIQIGIHDIGLSIVNDITREEMLYISLNKSKVIWTEQKKTRVKPLSHDANDQLEEAYLSYQTEREANPDDRQLLRKAYRASDYPEIVFNGDTAALLTAKGQRKNVKRQSLEGLWIDYSWSDTTATLNVRINRVQIDNQLDYTIFPVMLHPVVSKKAGNDLVEKPFIELSILELKKAGSDITQYKYFKLLIQEFAVKIDQGLIVAILAFLRAENNDAAPAVNMSTDIEQLQKSYDVIVKAQIDTPSGEAQMFFDEIHLSPLKIHVSFSMHGSKPTEELLAEYPLVGFLLQTLNVAEVQDVILRLGYYERKYQKYTMTEISNQVSAHYQNQFMKQLHVLVLGLDVLGNPFGVIRGLAEGVESFFYEPYKGAIEGPMEFAEGLATGVQSLLGSAAGGAAGAFSKITGVLGKGLATLTFDDDYKASRIRRKEPGGGAASDIAIGGKNVVMGFVDGVTGVVTKPISGAKHGGALGFAKGLGKGFLGLVTRPTGGIVDFTSTTLDLVKRTAQHEEIIRRVRYPRHVGRDGLVRPYIAHEATGFYILNRLDDGKYAKSDTYVAHITCSDSPPSWLLATSKRLLFVSEISFLGSYEVDWEIDYGELKDEPIIRLSSSQIQILTKDSKKMGTLSSNRTYGKMIKYQNVAEAKDMVEKIAGAMHLIGF